MALCTSHGTASRGTWCQVVPRSELWVSSLDSCGGYLLIHCDIPHQPFSTDDLCLNWLFHEPWENICFLIDQLGFFSKGRTFSHHLGLFATWSTPFVHSRCGRQNNDLCWWLFHAYFKECAFCSCWVECSINVNNVNLIDSVLTLFKSSISLLIFCLLGLTNTEKGNVEVSSYCWGLSIYPFGSVFASCILKLCYVYTYLGCYALWTN